MEPENHGALWTLQAKKELENLFFQGLSVEQIAAKIKRKPNAVCSQLERQNLVVNRSGLIYKVDPVLYYDNTSKTRNKK